MMAVSPVPADMEFAVQPVRPISRIFKTRSHWFGQFAGRLPGEYTVAKLDAFDRFRRETPPWQMGGILLLSPLSCLVVNVLVESIPLANPATGFHGSLHFQIRNFLVGMTVMLTLLTTKVSCLSRLTARSWKYIFGMSLVLAGVAIATNAAIAIITDVFPVPFTQFVPTGPMGVIGALMNRIFIETPENRARLQRLDRWLAMDLAPILIYPIFTAAFMAFKPQQQIWLSLLLPVLKLVLRYLLWIVIKDELDLVGAATCSVGHLYHILFTVMCLQNAKSFETYVAVVAVNIIHMMLNCRGILNDAYELRKAAEQLGQLDQAGESDTVSVVLAIAQQEQVSRLLHRKSPSRLFSTYPEYQLDDYLVKYHDLLLSEERSLSRNSRLANIKGRNSRWCSMPNAKHSKRSSLTASVVASGVQPLVSSFVRKNDSTKRIRSRQTYESQTGKTRQREAYVRCFTSALHQTEIILLRSYITIFVLPFYGIYQALLFILPNRKYFATMATTTTFDEVARMIYRMLVMCSLEFLFLVLYMVLISRQLGISAIHNLTFVLWSQRILIQGKFVMLPIMILGFPLAHFGNGIIFNLKGEK